MGKGFLAFLKRALFAGALFVLVAGLITWRTGLVGDLRQVVKDSGPATTTTSRPSVPVAAVSPTTQVATTSAVPTTSPGTGKECPSLELFRQVRSRSDNGTGFAINEASPPPAAKVIFQASAPSVDNSARILIVTLCGSSQGIWYFSRFKADQGKANAERTGLVTPAAPTPGGAGYQATYDDGSGPVTFAIDHTGVVVMALGTTQATFKPFTPICLEPAEIARPLADRLSSLRPPRSTQETVAPWAA